MDSKHFHVVLVLKILFKYLCRFFSIHSYTVAITVRLWKPIETMKEFNNN